MRLLDEAASSTDDARRLELFQQVQRLLAVELPYISLWNKTNFVVAQQSLTGVHVSTLADLMFLKDVARSRLSSPLTDSRLSDYNVPRMTKKPSRFLQTPIEPFVVEAGLTADADRRPDGADFLPGTQPRDRASRLAEDARQTT